MDDYKDRGEEFAPITKRSKNSNKGIVSYTVKKCLINKSDICGIFTIKKQDFFHIIKKRYFTTKKQRKDFVITTLKKAYLYTAV